jgi:hypothetical protein
MNPKSREEFQRLEPGADSHAACPRFFSIGDGKTRAHLGHRVNVKEATRKANEGLTGSGHDDELS